jgi:mannose-6-phosphate isomerase-like protein (cupin superfamily)
MTSRLKSRTWTVVAYVAAALLSGPTTMATVWLAAAAGFVVLPDGAAKFIGPQGREQDVTEVLATAEQTGGSLGMFRQTIAPGKGPGIHVHHTEDEFFYIVSGEFKLKLGDRVMNAPAQSVMFVPRGTAHTFLNVGDKPGVLLVGVTPGGLEGMFSKRQGVDAETNRMLMKAHNTEIVGPPLQ